MADPLREQIRSPIDPATPVLGLLDRLGPGALATGAPAMTLEEAIGYCRGLALSHYENFSVLTGLVPAELRDDFAAVYAFCRWADDLGDETGSDAAARERSLGLLGWWRGQVKACFAYADARGATDAPHRSDTEMGRSGETLSMPAAPTHPVFIALAETARRHARHGLTSRPFQDLISAFEQDQTVTRYQTWEQVLDYCTRSANPVGRIVLMLGGYAPPEMCPENGERYRLSDLTCTALQLINFWQDVRRDMIARDRVYLPLRDLGLTAEQLREWMTRGDREGGFDPAARVGFIKALRPLVERTGAMFDEARGLPRLLDRRIGPLVWLFGAGGEAIVHAVRHGGCATLWRRPRLGKFEKALLVACAWWKRRFW